MIVLLFYRYRHGKKMSMHFNEKDGFNKQLEMSLIKNLPAYSPNFLLCGPVVKEVVLTLREVPKPLECYSRHVYTFKDGGHTALDFYPRVEDIEPQYFEIKSKKGKIQEKKFVTIF